MRSRKVDPPDGGYGWVVVASAFLTMGLTAGVMKNIGLFFLEIQQHFGVLNSTTSWITSITITMFHLGAPVASALSMRFSQRVVIMVGGLLAASGMLLASLDLSLPWMYLSLGILQGTGIAFSWISANSMVSHYFLHWRPFAYALASSGECVFAIMFSPLFQWLIDAYTWQGALLFIGGLQLNLCVCGALMRPLEAPAQRGDLETKDDLLDCHAPEERRVIFQWSLLRKRELLLYIAFAILAAAGFFIPPLFLVPFATSLGMEHYAAASVLSMMAFADLVGRLTCGWLANMRLMRNLQLLTGMVTMLGVVLFLLPLSQNHWALLVFTSLDGFLFGCVVAIHVPAIVDIVGMESFDSGLGLFMLFRSTGGFIGPPAAGWLVDQTQDYASAFYFSGFCLVSSALFVLLTDLLVKKRNVRGTEGTEVGAPAPEYIIRTSTDEKSGMEESAHSVQDNENHVT